MEIKVNDPTTEKQLPANKKRKTFFLMPAKKVMLDVGIYFLINFIFMYVFLFFTHDTTMAVINVLWVGIIAWRGGINAGLIACISIYISNIVAMNMPPHHNIPMLYYFNNRVPGIVIGLSQSLVVCFLVGYISILFHKLREEIRLREKIQKELEHNIEELDAFGHTVAHDLKNPLMIINISIELLINDFKSSDDVNIKRKLALINDGSKIMINIIESLMLLAGIKKIPEDKFEVFPILESVEDALKRMEYYIKSNNVQIIKPDNWPSVFGFSPWITHVWVNYISNAIKYGGNPAMNIKPIIELGYDIHATNSINESEYIRFWVKDNGEGIAKDKTNTLFKEFTRLHSTRQEGHGLGLSIAKLIIEKSHGTVGLESDIGKGSLFYFTLPVRKY
ncbi:MAG TPA: hypothetical protein DCO75_09155 [Fibrobacteres bacterium]|jgi:signal transduction histidine kinase|nr:hypothetical protein [Fibrobacterota bacterium]